MATDWRLAVDIGGTFTDVVLLDAETGRVVVDKTLTTPSAPLDGVRTGVAQLLEKADVTPSEITKPIVHATTLITNALIEGKTGKAGLVTTKGFGDTLLIRDEHRYDMYDLQIEFPAPPIPSGTPTSARGLSMIRRRRDLSFPPFSRHAPLSLRPRLEHAGEEVRAFFIKRNDGFHPAATATTTNQLSINFYSGAINAIKTQQQQT